MNLKVDRKDILIVRLYIEKTKMGKIWDKFTIRLKRNLKSEIFALLFIFRSIYLHVCIFD